MIISKQRIHRALHITYYLRSLALPATSSRCFIGRTSMRRTPHRPVVLSGVLVLLITLLSSCAPPTPAAPVFPAFILITQDPNSSPTPTPFQPSGQDNTALPSIIPAPFESASPTITPQPTQTATHTPLPASRTPVIVAANTSVPPSPITSSRTNYILYATLDFTAHTLDVEETIRYYNSTGVALSDIVLSVQPNQYGNAFILNSILRDGSALTVYSLDGQRLTVNLPQSLQAGSATTLTLNFTLNIPAKSSTGIFGYDFNQINLVDWYPFLCLISMAGRYTIPCPLANISFTTLQILN
jgi:hypothetical protein